MTARRPAKGDRLGPYVLEARIGQGGFGEVWRARHVDLEGKVVAVKIPTDSDCLDLFRREGIVQHRLAHPAIVALHELDVDHDPPYLIMDLIDGESLRDRIARDAPLLMEEVLDYSRQILEALHFAHGAGVIHRDLKPENVLLPTRGGIKLADFGLGKIVDASRSMALLSETMRTGEGRAIVGTLAYMAPEQMSGEEPVDARADIFAFGVLFFEMLTGRLPAGSEVPSDHLEGLDLRFDAIYRRACTKLENRYSSAAAMTDDLPVVGGVSSAPKARTRPSGKPDTSRERSSVGEPSAQGTSGRAETRSRRTVKSRGKRRTSGRRVRSSDKPGREASLPEAVPKAPLNREDIAARVVDITCEQLGVDREMVTPETFFVHDLGADSLDQVELVMELEEEFDLNILDEQAAKIDTLGDAILFIEAYQRNPETAGLVLHDKVAQRRHRRWIKAIPWIVLAVAAYFLVRCLFA